MENVDSPTPPKKPRILETAIIHQGKPNQFLLPNNKLLDNVQPPKFTKVQRLLSINGKPAADSLQTMPYPSTMKFVPNKEINISNKLQKLKLKSPDGRDLGEINVKLFPQQVDNIRGKTITLKKHSILEKLENQQAAISILKTKNNKIPQGIVVNKQPHFTQSLPTVTTAAATTSNCVSLSSICAVKTMKLGAATTNARSNTEQKLDSEKTKMLFRHLNNQKCSMISNAPSNSQVILVKVDKHQQPAGLVKGGKSTQEDLKNLLESPTKSKVVMVRAENYPHLNSAKKKTACSTLVELRSYPSNKESGSGGNSTNGTANNWKLVEVVSKAMTNQGGKTTVTQSVANGKCNDKQSSERRDPIAGLVTTNESVNSLSSRPLTMVKTYSRMIENGAKSSCNEDVKETQTKSMEVTKIVQRNSSGVVKSKPEITQCVTITKNSLMTVEKPSKQGEKSLSIIQDGSKTQASEVIDKRDAAAKETDKSKHEKNPRENIMVILHGDANALSTNEKSKSMPENDTTRMEIDFKMGEDTNPTSKGCDEEETSFVSNESRTEASRLNETTHENSADILEKALSTLPDQEMREKALKALADCGIGVRRQVAVSPTVSVNDSITQTTIFGLYKPDMLIEVSESSLLLNSLPITKEPCPLPEPACKSNLIMPQYDGFSQISTGDSFIPNIYDPLLDDFSLLLADYTSEPATNNINKINSLLSKPDPKVLRVFEQLEKDYNAAKTTDSDGFTGIHRAVLSENIREVKRQLLFLKALRESVDFPTSNGKTSLELAVLHDASPEIVRYLLNEGAKPAFPMKLHESALVIACKMSSVIVPELIKHVDPPTLLDILDSEGFAPLHYCAQLGNSDAVRMLVSAGANVNLRDAKSGRTPLFHALENHFIELAWHLVENGASLNITNFAGQSPAALVDEYRHNALADKFNQLER